MQARGKTRRRFTKIQTSAKTRRQPTTLTNIFTGGRESIGVHDWLKGPRRPRNRTKNRTICLKLLSYRPIVCLIDPLCHQPLLFFTNSAIENGFCGEQQRRRRISIDSLHPHLGAWAAVASAPHSRKRFYACSKTRRSNDGIQITQRDSKI